MALGRNDAQTGQLMKGVGARGYVHNVLYPLLEDGERSSSEDRLYSNSWIYQEDGTAAHTSKETENSLNVVFKDRWIIDWQANSPDLSRIGNTWAWAENKLHCKRGSFRSANDFKAAVKEILQSLPIEVCRSYVRSMGEEDGEAQVHLRHNLSKSIYMKSTTPDREALEIK